MRVLLGSVTSDAKDYCASRFIDQIKGFDCDALVVDNSDDPGHTSIFKDAGIEVMHTPPWVGDDRMSLSSLLCLGQEILRKKAIEGNYDYLFLLESDCFVTNDLVDWAVAYHAPVYTLTYPIQLKATQMPSLCLQTTYVAEAPGVEYKHSNGLTVDPEFWLPADCKLIGDFYAGHLARLSGTGLGCTFIKRSIFKNIKFRIDYENEDIMGHQVFSDSYFYFDCLSLNIPVLLDTRIGVDHVKTWNMAKKGEIKIVMDSLREDLRSYKKMRAKLETCEVPGHALDEWDLLKARVECRKTIAGIEGHLRSYMRMLKDKQ